MKKQFPTTLQISFFLQSFDDLYFHVTMTIGFNVKCGEKGGRLFTRKVVKLRLDAKKIIIFLVLYARKYLLSTMLVM